MDIYDYLKKDHKKVNKLFKKIIAASTARERSRLFDEVKEELLLHAETEKKTFYQALKNYSETKEEADHGNKEHEEIKKLLASISKLKSNSKEWFIKFGELKYRVEHHVKEEENELFDKAKSIFSEQEAEELSENMDNEKKSQLE